MASPFKDFSAGSSTAQSVDAYRAGNPALWGNQYAAIQSGQVKVGPVSTAYDSDGNPTGRAALLYAPDGSTWIVDEVAPNVYDLVTTAGDYVQHMVVRSDPNSGYIEPIQNTQQQVNFGRWNYAGSGLSQIFQNPVAPLMLSALLPGAGSAIGSALGLGEGALSTAAGKALIGGTVSELSGGDFAKGALTSGLGSLVGSTLSTPSVDAGSLGTASDIPEITQAVQGIPVTATNIQESAVPTVVTPEQAAEQVNQFQQDFSQYEVPTIPSTSVQEPTVVAPTIEETILSQAEPVTPPTELTDQQLQDIVEKQPSYFPQDIFTDTTAPSISPETASEIPGEEEVAAMQAASDAIPSEEVLAIQADSEAIPSEEVQAAQAASDAIPSEEVAAAQAAADAIQQPSSIPNLSPSQIANLIKIGAGLFGGLSTATKTLTSGTGTTGGTPTTGNVESIKPFTGTYSGMNPYDNAYFQQVQQNYNRLFPSAPANIAAPLQSWYSTKFVPDTSISKKLFGI